MKDHSSYFNECKGLEEKLEQLKAAEASPHDIKKMEDQIAETAQMLPNAKSRIEIAVEDLQSFMGDIEETEETAATEEWKDAQQSLASAVAFAQTI